MALIFEYGDVTQSKKVTVPKKKSEELAAYKDALETRLGDGLDLNMLPGGGVLKRLAKGEYNGEKGNLKKKNGEEGPKTMTATDASTILNRMDKSINKDGINSPKNIVYNMAGKTIRDIANNTIKTAKVMSKQVQPVKPPKPTDQSDTKPEVAKSVTIEKPGGTIRLTASVEPRKVMEESNDSDTKISDERKNNKKIYISEAQVIKLKNKQLCQVQLKEH